MFFGSPKVSTDERVISELLTRGVADVFVKASLEQKLRSGKKLRVKLGFDPTGANIHIGRAVVLRKLKAFQNLGHRVVFIVGDFTARIGDPSDKLQKRPMLSEAQIAGNLKDYKRQVGKIIDLSKAEFCYNSAWLSTLGFAEIAALAESFSIQQMSNRRNFKERFERQEEISLREFMYPLMQGYDSMAVKADVELGGFDQLFNLKAGRVIQRHYGLPEQDVLTVQMLEGPDGRKMSTTWGNVITIVDEPNDMFGKVMSIRDELIDKYFLLATDLPEAEIQKLAERITTGGNPKESKIRLATEVVALYHGREAANKAASHFENTFTKGRPDVFTKVALAGRDAAQALVAARIIASKSELRRLIGEGAVTNLDMGETVGEEFITSAPAGKYRIGKHRFVEIR